MNIFVITIRLLAAAFFGGIIGVEREHRDKSAGFRTIILISVGSALFTILALEIAADFPRSDPARIVGYIVGGIGFLGAGAIMKDGLSVRGLTTASTIWVAAALGVASGGGFYLVAAIATINALVALIFLPFIEQWIDRQSETRRYQILLKDASKMNDTFELFKKNQLNYFKVRKSKKPEGLMLKMDVNGKPTHHDRVSDALYETNNVISF